MWVIFMVMGSLPVYTLPLALADIYGRKSLLHFGVIPEVTSSTTTSIALTSVCAQLWWKSGFTKVLNNSRLFPNEVKVLLHLCRLKKAAEF